MKRAFLVPFLFAAAPALAQPTPPDPTGGEPPPVTPPVPTQPEPPQPPPHHEEIMPPAPPPAPEPAAAPASTPTTVKGKTELSFYGFVQLYNIFDSTQGFNEQLQAGAIARPGTYAGDHGQTMISARHSRFGFKVSKPLEHDIKASAQFEMDFLGNQPANPQGGVTENAFFQNAALRFRHVYAKLETPFVDVVGGQWWSLFGWQSYFHPNSVEIQGLPGQAYKRTAQLRISKTIKTDAFDVDLAIAAQRPPERASATPDGVAGIKLTFNHLKGWRTRGANDSGLDAAAIGASVIGRHFAVDQFSAAPTSQVTTNGYGLSLDAMIPIIGATKASHAGALTVTGSFVRGAGIEDQYDGLTFGVANPNLPIPMGQMTAPTFAPNFDPGMVMFTDDGVLHAVKVQTWMVGLQYYFLNNAWVAFNYTNLHSDNAIDFGAKAWNDGNYFDANLFIDATSAVRIGLLYSRDQQTFVTKQNDQNDAVNTRLTATVLYLF